MHHLALCARRLSFARSRLSPPALALSSGRRTGAYTAVMLAAEKGRDKVVELLLDRGARIDAKQKVCAPRRRCSPRIAPPRRRTLRNRRAPSHYVRPQHGRTALHLAAAAGRATVVAVLAARGADLEARDDEGYTPLILAARYGQLDTCRALLNAHADVRAIDAAGNTAADAARHGGFAAVADALIDAELG